MQAAVFLLFLLLLVCALLIFLVFRKRKTGAVEQTSPPRGGEEMLLDRIQGFLEREVSGIPEGEKQLKKHLGARFAGAILPRKGTPSLRELLSEILGKMEITSLPEFLELADLSYRALLPESKKKLVTTLQHHPVENMGEVESKLREIALEEGVEIPGVELALLTNKLLKVHRLYRLTERDAKLPLSKIPKSKDRTGAMVASKLEADILGLLPHLRRAVFEAARKCEAPPVDRIKLYLQDLGVLDRYVNLLTLAQLEQKLKELRDARTLKGIFQEARELSWERERRERETREREAREREARERELRERELRERERELQERERERERERELQERERELQKREEEEEEGYQVLGEPEPLIEEVQEPTLEDLSVAGSGGAEVAIPETLQERMLPHFFS